MNHQLTIRKSPLKKLKCRWGWCGCKQHGDDNWCWAECIECGKQTAFVHRKVLSSYSDLMEAHKKHKELVASIGEHPSEYSVDKEK